MGTAAWICLNCRTAIRRNTMYTGEVPCPGCGEQCVYLGYKIPVPSKSKIREWSALREQLAREKNQRELAADAKVVRDRYTLEQEIARLEAMPINDGRTKAIRLLQRRLSGSNA